MFLAQTRRDFQSLDNETEEANLSSLCESGANILLSVQTPQLYLNI